MTLYQTSINVSTGQAITEPLTAEQAAGRALLLTALDADTLTIDANGVDTATVTVTTDLDSVTVSVDGEPVVVIPAVDDTLEITSDAPGLIPVMVVGGSAALEIVAVEV